MLHQGRQIEKKIMTGNAAYLVVAPISAPMLQMVPMPVQESDSTPGP
jgi:hypothetical protein